MTVAQWVDPATRATGAIVSAEIWDQDVVDNSWYLHNRPVGIFRIATTTVPDVTNTQIDLFGSVIIDNDNMDENLVASNVITIQTAGVYALMASLQMAQIAGAGDGTAWIQHSDGSIIAARTFDHAASVGEPIYLSLEAVYQMTVGDQISLYVYQDSAGDRDVSGSTNGGGLALALLSSGEATP